MKHILIIGFVWPEPNSSAAGSRMMQLIYAIQSKGYKITFASPSIKNENAFDLSKLGIGQVTIEINNSSFDVFIKHLKPTIVLFDRFTMEEQFGWRVAEHCPNTMRILDTEDLHGLRKGRQQAFNDRSPFETSYLFNDFAKREIASIYRCDLSLIISEPEMEILQTQFNVDKQLLYYLPFMIEEVTAETIKKFPKYEERQHFITVGNFLHEPNFNSVLYLKETIWPFIKRQLPKVELHIYGAYASQKVNELHNEEEGFLVKGFSENVDEVMQNAKVCLAPLRFGAGLKGKLIDAMKNGTPSVTTTIGAEGMFGNLGPNGFIEDTTEGFVGKAIELYTNKRLWSTKQTNGFVILKKRFNKKYLEPDFIKSVEVMKENLEFYRLQNFTGAMLQFHTMQSTKFMSKWIEEKNKK